jgi:hypothetical protein
MFRRLAQLEGYQSSGADAIHTAYNQSQSNRYNAVLPRMIPTNSSYPVGKEFNAAIRSVDPALGRTVDPVPLANQLFQPAGGALTQQAQACESASLDQLLASQTGNNPVGCGWVYTPPTAGSSVPQLAKGVLGTSQGPLPSADLPTYKKYYWDLAQAKKQMLLDKCRALKSCGDTGTQPFGPDCGYCVDLGQGVPIDANGAPLYTDTPLSYCSPGSLIIPSTVANCPAPPPPGSTPGPQPPKGPCTADSNGRLSAICLETLLTQGGCSDQGSLAQALGSGATPADYMATARTLPSMQLYAKSANPALNLTTLSQGQLTTAAALQEFQQLAANTKQPATSALGASARDLCLQAGSIQSYNFCQDLPLSTLPPFDTNLQCLQSYFLQAGGTPAGRMYPSTTTLPYYNTNFKTLGDIVSYFKGLKGQATGTVGLEGFTAGGASNPLQLQTRKPMQKQKGKEGFVDTDPYGEASATTRSYVSQATALLDLQGILPDQLSGRPPHTAGIECLWLAPAGSSWRVVGYTVERTLPFPIRFNAQTLITLTDLRVMQDVQAKMQTQTGGAIFALNQEIDWNGTPADEPGYLNLIARNQPTTPYTSTACWNLSAAAPNFILGWTSNMSAGLYSMSFVPCNPPPTTQTPPLAQGFSMVREYGAPFFLFERKNGSASITDLVSNNFWFSTETGTIASSGLVFPSISDAALKAPGTNGYTSFPPRAYLVNPTISPSTWNTMTFAFRLTSLPILDTFLTITSSGAYMQLNVKSGGSAANVLVSNNIPTVAATNAPTQINLNVNQWYLGIVRQQSTAAGPTQWTVNFVDLQTAAQGQTSNTASSTTLRATDGRVFDSNTTPVGLVAFGGNAGSVVAATSNTLSFDLAWMHFFSSTLPFTADMVRRDALNDWKMLTV